jgi:hypothetical protein
MLGLSGETGYIHEPFLPNRSPGWITEPLPYWYMYICSDNGAEYRDAMARVLSMRYPLASLPRSRSAKSLAAQLPELPKSARYRVRGARPLIKDPLALFSSEWLADEFGMQIVVMIREAAAFVSSIKRLNWGFDYERNWLAQDLLMRDLLGHRADEYRGYQGEVDIVGEGIVIWNSIYDVVDQFRGRRPDWSFVKYESVADDPVAGFERLYGALGLSWSPAVAEKVRQLNSAKNPGEVPIWKRRAVKRDSAAAKTTWRARLSPEEIERVRAETREVALKFYTEAELSPT